MHVLGRALGCCSFGTEKSGLELSFYRPRDSAPTKILFFFFPINIREFLNVFFF
jgi:hypothetical protein